MYSYQEKRENKKNKVRQLYPQNVKALKSIRLHTQREDGTEDRTVKMRIPAEAEFVVDTEQSWIRMGDNEKMVYALYNNQKGFVKNMETYWEEVGNARKMAVIEKLYHKFADSIHPIQLEGLEEIQHSNLVKSGQCIDADPILWEKIFTEIGENAINLIALKYHQKVSIIKLAGGDPHRDGKIPLIVTFINGTKIVYKPGSLLIDQALFGSERISAANLLSSPQQKVPSYRIEPTDPTYGDMEFLETELPDTKADIIGIFKSIGANMAMSYFFGLDDLHKENFILQKDKIQLIDMEVVTGVFGNPVLEGWRTLLSELRSKIFLVQITNRELQLQEPDAKAAVEQAFRSTYSAAMLYKIQPDNAQDVRPVLPVLQTILTASVRFVPFKTEIFYSLIPKAKKKRGLEAWHRYIDGLTDDLLPPSSLKSYSKRLILKDPDTYTALITSNIPIFMRRLNCPDVVYNSSGMPILLSGRLNPSTGMIDSATAETAPIIHSTMEEQLILKWAAAGADANACQRIFEQFWEEIKSVFYR